MSRSETCLPPSSGFECHFFLTIYQTKFRIGIWWDGMGFSVDIQTTKYWLRKKEEKNKYYTSVYLLNIWTFFHYSLSISTVLKESYVFSIHLMYHQDSVKRIYLRLNHSAADLVSICNPKVQTFQDRNQCMSRISFQISQRVQWDWRPICLQVPLVSERCGALLTS